MGINPRLQGQEQQAALQAGALPARQQGPLPAAQPSQQPLTAQPPQPTGVIPRSDTVITSNKPKIPMRKSPMFSAMVEKPQFTDAQSQLQQYVDAHKKYAKMSGRTKFPFPRDIVVGDKVIPASIVARIGDGDIKPTITSPEIMLKPGETWERVNG